MAHAHPPRTGVARAVTAVRVSRNAERWRRRGGHRRGAGGSTSAQHPLDERPLGFGVGLAVEAKARGQLALERRVFAGQRRAAAQRVAQGKPLLPQRAVQGQQVQMVGAVAGRGLAEPVHELDLVGGVDVARSHGGVDDRA